MTSIPKKQQNPVAPPAPCSTDQDALWDELMQQIGTPSESAKTQPWRDAIDQIQNTDAQQLLDGQRFHGQGQ